MTRFRKIRRDGVVTSLARDIIDEHPVAIEINGLGYAVMMATPDNLEDFAVGLALSERLADSIDDIVGIDQHPHPKGSILRLTLAERCLERVTARVRHRVTESACGLCGIENLEATLQDLPVLTCESRASDDAIFLALAALSDHQPLNAKTGAAHAAALCGEDGTIRLVREDVGRHNGFDKLIGAMARSGMDWDGGFALLSSRCSYELVEKAVLANCPMLVTISAPTRLALSRATEAGLALVVLARPDSLLRPLTHD
jgi:FdhD protein